MNVGRRWIVPGVEEKNGGGKGGRAIQISEFRYPISEFTSPQKAGLCAERVGFEPTIPLPVYHLSRVASSTAPAPLQMQNRVKIYEESAEIAI